MQKFGLFKMGASVPANEYKGDYMTQDGDYVKIFIRATNPSLADEQVVAIRLDKSQFVQKIQ